MNSRPRQPPKGIVTQPSPCHQHANPTRRTQPSRRKDQENPNLPQAGLLTSSANSSQEFGISNLSLGDYNTKKRSPTRKGEPPPEQDQDGYRSGMKRQKVTPDRQNTRSPPVSRRKGSPRARRRDRPANQPQLQARPSSLQVGPTAATTPSTAPKSKSNETKTPQSTQPRHPPPVSSQQDPPREINMPTDPRYPGIYLQPESREISQEQLAAEVKSIYSGLSMVEAKCIHVDAAQSAAIQNAEKGGTHIVVEEHWQALIALHRTLLHEHHDFFLASQHPSASPALKRLAAKYSMPARMWKHGIHSFLELLRCRLPQSREYMRTFIYFAYHMMALLFETVPSFEDTWIECLGDLGRYRMAIEDDDPRERDSWAGISQSWYRMAADRSPGVGRLYHHLAILARSEAFQQIYYYCRSFTCVQLFPSARESVLAVFEPIFNRSNTSATISRIDTFYTKMHGMIFLRKQLEDFKAVTSNFLELLDNHISRSGIKWREHGAWLAISNIGALFEHGSNHGVLRRLFEHLALRRRQESEGVESENIDTQSISSRGPPTPSSSIDMAMFEPDLVSQQAFYYALDMTVFTLKLVLQRSTDRNVLPHVHILLALVIVLTDIQSFGLSVQREYVAAILDRMPWEDLSSFATTLANSDEFGSRYETTSFLQPEPGDVGPLPEDYLLRGQVWTQILFPEDWWRDGEIDPEEKQIEHASTVRKRGERILNHMYRLALHDQWIRYDAATKSWSAIPRSTHDGHSPAPSPTIEIAPAPPSLTVETSQDAEMEIAEESELQEPDDSSMEDLDSSLSDDDSPEMLLLKKEDRLLHASERLQASQGHSLQVPPQSLVPVKAAKELMRKGYTVRLAYL